MQPAPDAARMSPAARSVSTTPVDPDGLRELRLTDYEPRSRLIHSSHPVPRARFGAVDCHAHLGRWLAPDADWVAADLAGDADAHAQCNWPLDVSALIAAMDACGIAASVNLDGRWGAELEANLDRYDRPHPDRFLTFCHLPWGLAAAAPGFAAELVEVLRASAAAGARGLKVWKTLGLGFRDHRGELLMPDDDRIAPIFAAAGELGLPVLIHTADPAAFFDPPSAANERLEELLEHPEWSYAGPGLPSHARLIESLAGLVESHPETTFIAAHLAGNADDLDWVSGLLHRNPNLYVDVAARIPDLGRQPRAARRLILAHRERVLLGTDELPPSTAGYRRYLRFLESEDECYLLEPEDQSGPGRWPVSALGLPEAVLEDLYVNNPRNALGIDGGRTADGNA